MAVKDQISRFTNWLTSIFSFGRERAEESIAPQLSTTIVPPPVPVVEPTVITEQQYWEEHIPITKKQAIEMLKRGLPEKKRIKVELTVDKDGSGSLSITSKGIEESRCFNLNKKAVEAGYLKLAKTGKGVGRKIMRNEIEFFLACGIKTFEVHAGLDAGGYTWARFGFLPDNDGEHKSAFNELKKEIHQRYKQLAPLFPDKEKSRLKQIIKLKKKKDVWRLADSRFNITPRLHKVFKAAANNDKRAQELQENIESIMSPSIRSGLDVGTPQPIGRLLLAGTYWEGRLNLEDKQQMRRVKEYVGGLRQPRKHRLSMR